MTFRLLMSSFSLALLLSAASAQAAQPAPTQDQAAVTSQNTPMDVATPTDDRLPPPKPPKIKVTGDNDDSGGTTDTNDGTPKKPVVKKPTSTDDGAITKKPTTKKKTKKKKKKVVDTEAELPYGLGVKVGLMPYAAMSAETKTQGNRDYNMTMSYGLGLDGHYRLANGFYLTAEAMYWWTEIEQVDDNSGKTDYNANSGDAMLDLGIGAKYVFLGSEKTSDRVYGRGYLGYSYYVSSDDNAVDDNRGGLYYGLTAGLMHKMGQAFSLFAEGGLMFRSFTNTGGDEKDAFFWDIQAQAGFMYHWK